MRGIGWVNDDGADSVEAYHEMSRFHNPIVDLDFEWYLCGKRYILVRAW
jgi:hypothetical protein